MTKLILETINGLSVTFHSTYKENPFVVKRNGKVVAKYNDWLSCLNFIYMDTGNFERERFMRAIAE